MVAEAEAAAEEDKAQKERVESRNQLENYVYQIRNAINDEEKVGGKISAEDKETIEAAVKEQIDWLDDNQTADKDEFDAQYKELERVVQPIFSKLYGGEHTSAPGFHDDDSHESTHDEL